MIRSKAKTRNLSRPNDFDVDLFGDGARKLLVAKKAVTVKFMCRCCAATFEAVVLGIAIRQKESCSNIKSAILQSLVASFLLSFNESINSSGTFSHVDF